MLKKIGDYLALFAICLSALVLMAFGILVLYYVLCFLASIIMIPWLCAGLIVGFAVGWSIVLYKNLNSEPYPEIADAFRWHIINYGEPMTWGSSVLEFRTKESANRFLADLNKVDNDYFGCYVTKDPCITNQPVIDATNLKPIYNPKEGAVSYLEER